MTGFDSTSEKNDSPSISRIPNQGPASVIDHEPVAAELTAEGRPFVLKSTRAVGPVLFLSAGVSSSIIVVNNIRVVHLLPSLFHVAARH
jgi:hypothetical protein